MLKNNKVRFTAAFISLITISQLVTAQSFNSPYSLYGIGELSHLQFTRHMGMGGVSLSLYDNTGFSLNNPASYANLDYTTLDADIRYNYRTFTFREQSSYTSDLSLGNVVLGLPISNRSGIAIGLTPFSEVSYRLRYTGVQDDIPRHDIFEGHGSFSKFFAGFGTEVFKNLSIGGNISYLFGKARHSHLLAFPDTLNMLNLSKTSNSNMGDLVFDAGIQHHIYLTDTSRQRLRQIISWGAKYDFGTNVRTTEDNFVFAYTFQVRDTLEAQTGNVFQTYLPMGAGLGVSYSSLDSANGRSFTIGADAYYRKWTDFSRSDKPNDSLNDYLSLALGFAYSPAQTTSQSFLSAATYRGGIKYAKPSFVTAGEPLTQFSVFVGTSLPLKKAPAERQALSTLDLGIEAGWRGNSDNNDINETFINVQLGLRFASGRWFKQSKID